MGQLRHNQIELQTPQPLGEAERLAFDRWLTRELSKTYGSVLDEPIPERLLRLLQEEPSGPKRRK